MRIRIRRWEWFFYGAIAMGGFLEWWIGGLNYFPHLLVILFWLIIFRIFLYGIGQFWDLLTGRDTQQMGKELEERVASFISETEKDIEEFGKNFLNKKTITDYRLSHPESFEGKKFKACHNCGDRSIWVKQMGTTRYGIHNQHICRTCGTALWRSNL